MSSTPPSQMIATMTARPAELLPADHELRTQMVSSHSPRKSPLQAVYKHFKETSPMPAGGLSRRVSDLFRSSSREKFTLDDATTGDMRRIEQLLHDRDLRNSMVDAALASHNVDIAMKIRFLAAYNDWAQSTDRKVRIFKAKKIVTVFFSCRSAFHLKNIPSHIEQELHAGRHDALVSAQNAVLVEIAQDPAILAFLASCEED